HVRGRFSTKTVIEAGTTRAPLHPFLFSFSAGGGFFSPLKTARRLLLKTKPAGDPNFEDAATLPSQACLCRGSQLEDLFPHLTGARFIASLTAIFDLDFHEMVLAG